MLATIDGGGRIVVPKEIRERLGLVAGTRVDILEVDGHLEIAPAATPMVLEQRDGILVARTDEPMPVLTADQVRATMESTRR